MDGVGRARRVQPRPARSLDVGDDAQALVSRRYRAFLRVLFKRVVHRSPARGACALKPLDRIESFSRRPSGCAGHDLADDADELAPAARGGAALGGAFALAVAKFLSKKAAPNEPPAGGASTLDIHRETAKQGARPWAPRPAPRRPAIKAQSRPRPVSAPSGRTPTTRGAIAKRFSVTSHAIDANRYSFGYAFAMPAAVPHVLQARSDTQRELQSEKAGLAAA